MFYCRVAKSFRGCSVAPPPLYQMILMPSLRRVWLLVQDQPVRVHPASSVLMVTALPCSLVTITGNRL